MPTPFDLERGNPSNRKLEGINFRYILDKFLRLIRFLRFLR